ncbi:hypothetical protein [Streptomyces sp. 1222.5]|uniref:hypothetical protein n=1 Tax=Streptomyces sp. 1222.5 TaxID=1881026 RepID=UPI0015A3B975|nr:hypothetical protein [Streptomyces sp. 1222.5]
MCGESVIAGDGTPGAAKPVSATPCTSAPGPAAGCAERLTAVRPGILGAAPGTRRT